MPKENTHLHFAHGLLEEFQGTELLEDVSEHPRHYLLGSIIPDTFYYSPKAEPRRISETFHGKGGNPTNTPIIQVLEGARHKKDIAFILGYISHCALDIAFHPVIYYLSGNYYDESPEKRRRAVYMHRHLETCLDIDIGNTMYLHRLIKKSHLTGLVFEDIISEGFHVPVRSIRHCLSRQIIFNRIFMSTAAYRLFKVLSHSGLIKDSTGLGLFYGDAYHGNRIPSVITVADLLDGSEKNTSISELFKNAHTSAKSMMEAAYSFWKKSIDCETLVRAIPGVSLDTGRMGAGASSIRYTKDNPPVGPYHWQGDTQSSKVR